MTTIIELTIIKVKGILQNNIVKNTAEESNGLIQPTLRLFTAVR